MTTSGRSSVLVIGCGPAGASAAITLAEAGIDVVVVDRARFPRPKTCGDAVSNDAVGILRTLGAAESVLAGPHAKVRVARALLPDGSLVQRAYDPPGLIVPRLSLDQALREAVSRAGARVIEGAAVRRVVTSDGQVTGATGPELDWEAEVVIAADGHGSVARAALGHRKPAGRYLGVARTVYLRGVRFPAGPDASDHYFEHHLPCGYGWVFPEFDGLSNVGVYQRGDSFARGAGTMRAALERFLNLHPERFADAEPVDAPRTWPLPVSPAPWARWAPGLIAVGDAANTIDPLSGEGIWQALRTGQIAGQLIASSGLRGAEFGAEYARLCREEVERAAGRRARIQDALARVVSLRMYRLPPVRWLLGWGYGRQSLEATKSL